MGNRRGKLPRKARLRGAIAAANPSASMSPQYQISHSASQVACRTSVTPFPSAPIARAAAMMAPYSICREDDFAALIKGVDAATAWTALRVTECPGWYHVFAAAYPDRGMAVLLMLQQNGRFGPLGNLAALMEGQALSFSGYLFQAGIVLFSGSLYIVAISGIEEGN